MLTNINKVSKPYTKGFTIVELLVVIVVIGILAAITIASYTGINAKAITASIQSDLSNAAVQLKIFQVDQSRYPANVSVNCVTNPDSLTNKCLKASNGNSYIYEVDNPANPQAFTLTSRNSSANITYVITNNTAPTFVPPPPVATGGDSTNTAAGYKIHTFTSNGTLYVTASGTAYVTIIGAGGGGGGGSYYCDGGPGTSGGLSSIAFGTLSLIANGGTGGSNCPTNGTNGTAVITNGGSFTNTTNPSTGGAANGGAGSTDWQCPQCDPYEGGTGGSGGKITGYIDLVAGQNVTIVVGGAGAGGYGTDMPGGDPGGSGLVTFRYIN